MIRYGRFVTLAALGMFGWAALASARPIESRAPEANASTPLDLSAYFEGVDACMVWLEKESGTTRRYRSERCSARHAPCSTFKIPNALIGLETGVVRDGAHVFAWDGVEREREATNRDHDLRSAIRDSVVWYFQRLAAGVGEERMRASLARVGYGNEDTSGGLTQFWLRSSLRISADEQVRFLERLIDGELPFSERNLAIVKDALVLERTEDGVFCGKTGSGRATADEADLGWFVGWVQSGDRTVVFAVNVLGDDMWGWKVQKIVRSVLADRGVWPVKPPAKERAGAAPDAPESSGSRVGMPKGAAEDSLTAGATRRCSRVPWRFTKRSSNRDASRRTGTWCSCSPRTSISPRVSPASRPEASLASG